MNLEFLLRYINIRFFFFKIMHIIKSKYKKILYIDIKKLSKIKPRKKICLI